MSGALSHSGTSGNFTWGHLTIYGAGSNGGINSLLIGDDVTIGDCNLGGIMGMKSTGANCGFKFFNSSGTAIGVLQSTAGTLQFDGQNIIHSGNISSQSVSSATTATKLGTDAGGSTTPVYFSGGKPVACTAYSSASVNYATSAGNTNIIKRIWERGNDCKSTASDFPYTSQTRFYMYDSSSSNKPTSAAGFMMVNGWDWGPGGSILAQNFDDGDNGRLIHVVDHVVGHGVIGKLLLSLQIFLVPFHGQM